MDTCLPYQHCLLQPDVASGDGVSGFGGHPDARPGDWSVPGTASRSAGRC